MKLTRKQLREQIILVSEMYRTDDDAATVAGQLYDIVATWINTQISDFEEEGEWELADELEAGFDDAVVNAVSALIRDVMPQKLDISKLGH